MVNPNEDTEFNDALRARGILPPKPPSRSPSPDIPHITHTDAVRAIAATADTAQLDLLLEGENLSSDDEAVFESYRRRRMDEMRREEKRGRWGSVMPLGREDFVREVTEGSKERAEGGGDGDGDGEGESEEEDEEEGSRRERAMLDAGTGAGTAGGEGSRKRRKLKGTGVVVFLYKDSIHLSQHLRPLLNQLAPAHPYAKFMAIRADLCIPNYPDKNVPTLLVYRNGEMVGQVVAGAGLRGMKTSVQDLEALLIRYQALEKPSPALRRSGRINGDADDDAEAGLGDDVGMVNTKSSAIRKGGTGPGVGAGAVDSDESDFDM